jgi:molecular chaperone GrpE (heat shock protein)
VKQGQQTERRKSSKDLIGEMMLAKTVLEEKNELLDQKDQQIQELLVREKQLRRELGTMTQQLEFCQSELAEQRATGIRKGECRVVEEVLRIAADFEEHGGEAVADLARRILTLFQRNYGLEVLATVPSSIDPQIHCVAEVSDQNANEPAIQVLAKGYKMAGRLIRPMMLRVSKGALPPCKTAQHLHVGQAVHTVLQPPGG